MIVEHILSYLESEDRVLRDELLMAGAQRFAGIMRRQLMEAREHKTCRLMPSNIGKCPKALAYYKDGFVRQALPARTHIKFFLGDVAETGLLVLSDLAGATILNNQLEVQTEVGRGFIDGTNTCDGITRLVEIKSMTGQSFKRFEKDGPDETWGYLSQINCYLRALNLQEAIYLALSTDTGHIAEHLVKRQDDIFVPRLEELKLLMELPAEEVARPEWATLKRMPRAKCWEVEDVRCGYCDCVEKCWPGAEVVFVSGKPKHRIPFKEGASE